MACPKCGCKVHYQFNSEPGFEPDDERLERCAACGAVFDIEDSADEDDDHYAKLEREHFGDPDKGTGIYADLAPAVRECCNAECGWKGETSRMCGSVGPLCPECGEVTESA